MRTPAARTLADYGVIARRSWWLILGTVVAALAAGLAFTTVTEKVYESTASVLVMPVPTDTDVAGARTAGPVNLDTEAQLVKSTEIAQAAAERLSAPSSAELSEQVSVAVPPNTSVLEISFQASDPRAARSGTIAFSEAYLDHRASGATDSIQNAIVTAQTRLSGVESELLRLEDELSALDRMDDGRSVIESELDDVAGQAGALESEIASLESQQEGVTPGRIINRPALPESPVAPNALFNLAAALAAGLMLGLMLAWARHRLARRVAIPADLIERCELEVLGTVPRSVKFQRREVFAAYSPGGRAFSQMRNVITSQLTDDRRVVVVAGVAPGPAASVAAANLATAMARAGDRVTAVAANPSTTVGLPELFGTESVPGLSDVWSGRVDLSETMQSAPRQPSLSVIGPGAAARAAGPTSEAAAETFTKLAQAGRIVLVDAPPLSCSADAQLLAAHADAVVLAVQAQRDSIAETSAAATAMRQIDTPLLGAVLLPNTLGPMADVPLQDSGPQAMPRRALPAADDTPTDSLDQIEDSYETRAAETR